MKRKKKERRFKKIVYDIILSILFAAVMDGAIFYIICNIDRFSTIYK